MDEFNNFINDICMEDMGARGQRFTWCSNRRGQDRVYESLDRMIMNERWATKFPNAKCINEVVVGSDHAPLVLTLEEGRRRRVRNFRFEEMWLENPECKEVIRDAWKDNDREGQRRKLWPKLGGCRRSLKEWSKARLGNNMKEMKGLKTD